MPVHTFSNEQMFKFLDAIGGVAEVGAGEYTTQQLRELARESGGLKGFPKHTDDQHVNYAVDCTVEEEGDEPAFDEGIYGNEIIAFQSRH